MIPYPGQLFRKRMCCWLLRVWVCGTKGPSLDRGGGGWGVGVGDEGSSMSQAPRLTHPPRNLGARG